jgi:hypothetical protein
VTRRIGVALAIAALLSFVAADSAASQVRPAPPKRPVPPPVRQPQSPTPGQPQPTRTNVPGARTVPGDTIRVDTTAQFSEPDSVMAELLRKQGYTVTRYEGDVVTFDALTKALAIAASAAQKALVDREGLKVQTDSVIVYEDETQKVNVRGRYVIIPGAGQSPIEGVGTLRYDVGERSGRLTNARVTVEEQGQRWFINSEIGKTVLGDSSRAIPPRFYGMGGALTSCEDSVWHYHFRMREVKRTEKTLVARPAVLYLEDVPVMWLPFVFQDIRPGRRSGVLPPRLGASDIVRNNPGYRRHIENIGYYWAFSDYADMAMWLNWRSSAGAIDSIDPGWYEVNGEWKYKVSSRFIDGRFAAAYQHENDGDAMHRFSWDHRQRLGRNRNFSSQMNYTSSTTLQRRNTFIPAMAMATIASSFAYSDKIGPASLQLGGRQSQYPGRQQIDRTIPTVTLTAGSISPGEWLVWTPSFSFTENASLKIDQPTTFMQRFIAGPNGQVIDVDTLRRDRYNRAISFGTPVRIFGMDFQNDVRITDAYQSYPEEFEFFPEGDSTRKEFRVFHNTYRTDVDWNPMFSLPPFFQNRFKLSPSISLQNVDGRPFWVRSHLSGGKFVHQSKRLTYGVSAAPTIFGLLPGFGPFLRFRHMVSPVLSYSYAPAKKVSNEYLQAVGQNRQVYLGALAQNAVSLSLSQNIEAKVRSRTDSGPSVGQDGTEKLKVLSLQLSPMSYDFERARVTGRKLSGLTSEQMNIGLTSDLLPGFNLAMNYSLFEGSTQTDTARFDPFLTSISSQLRFSKRENPFTVLTRLFGKALPEQSPAPQAMNRGNATEAEMSREFASQPIAGQASRGNQFLVPTGAGWEMNFNFSISHPRPLRGDRIIEYDANVRCQGLSSNPFLFEECMRQPALAQPFDPLGGGAPAVQMPRQSNVSADTRFALTQHWAAAWNTSYDFEQRQFAQHVVSLQRDLHDWRAIFAFTHSPNGNFAFNFFIALKPQPELKFDYSRATIRSR